MGNFAENLNLGNRSPPPPASEHNQKRAITELPKVLNLKMNMRKHNHEGIELQIHHKLKLMITLNMTTYPGIL